MQLNNRQVYYSPMASISEFSGIEIYPKKKIALS